MESTFEKIVLQSMHMPHMHISIIIITLAALNVNFLMVCFSFPQESIFKSVRIVPYILLYVNTKNKFFSFFL